MTKERKRIRKTAWKEPDRHDKAPTLMASAVARLLECSVSSVYQLTHLGPEWDGLAAYIPAEQEGWTRKTPENARKGMPSFYYKEDVLAWKKAHPFKEPVSPQYTNEQRDIILQEAKKLMQNDGSVNRRQVLRAMTANHGIHAWNTRTYPVIRKVLDDAKIPGQMRKNGNVKVREYR